jgi:hypothetical protein
MAMINHPVCTFLKVLEKFDHAEYPAGTRYKLEDNVLYCWQNEAWQPSKLSFNEVLAIFEKFSGKDMNALLDSAQGSQEAEDWRWRIQTRRGRDQSR